MISPVGAACWRVAKPVLVLVAVAAAGVAGAVGATNVKLAAALAGGMALIALTVRRPMVCAVIALVAVFASWRLGGNLVTAGNEPGVSYSDVFLAAATLLSVPALIGTKGLRRLRLAGWGVAIYLAFLLPTVLLNSSQRGYVEWLHRLVLLGGSLLVGAWIAREGKARPALRWLVFAACIVAAATVLDAVRHGWLNSAPFGLNKNLVGQQIATVLVVVFMAREHLAIPTAWWRAIVGILSAGLIASHSRGGALAAGVGLFLALMLSGRVHKRGTKVLAALAAACLAVFIYVSVRDQLDSSRAVVSNSSIGVRFKVDDATLRVWRTSPIYGVGLKYFDTSQYGPFAQPATNDFYNELAESGVIGLTGFVVLQGAVLSAGLRRGRSEQLVAAGCGAVAGLLAHGMVDIYWIAGYVTLPFIIMGMALAHEPPNQNCELAQKRAQTRTHEVFRSIPRRQASLSGAKDGEPSASSEASCRCRKLGDGTVDPWPQDGHVRTGDGSSRGKGASLLTARCTNQCGTGGPIGNDFTATISRDRRAHVQPA